VARFREDFPDAARPTLVAAGGVAANAAIGSALADLAGRHGFDIRVPPPQYCTDNAAMIAWAGLERFALGRRDPLDISPRARWPLDASGDGGHGGKREQSA
jgi:N6-L-threonylcarbamoyladenine synthase